MPTKSAFSSRGVWGGATAIIASLISFSHTVNIVGFAQAVVDNWPAIVGLFGGVFAIYGRIRASVFIAPDDPVKAGTALGVLLAGAMLASGALSLQSCAMAPVLAGNDPVVVHAEQVYQDTFDVTNAVFTLDAEPAVRNFENQSAPRVHAAINSLKPVARVALQDAHNALATYKASRTADHQATLNTAIATLMTVLAEAQQFQAQLAAAK